MKSTVDPQHRLTDVPELPRHPLSVHVAVEHAASCSATAAMVCGCADPYGQRVLGDARTASVHDVWTGADDHRSCARI